MGEIRWPYLHTCRYCSNPALRRLAVAGRSHGIAAGEFNLKPEAMRCDVTITPDIASVTRQTEDA